TIPELLRNPGSGVTDLLKDVTGVGGGGLADELKRSPSDSIVARGAAGSGRVDLQQAVVQSSAVRADAKGAITLADVLTNSPDGGPPAHGPGTTNPDARRSATRRPCTQSAGSYVPDSIAIRTRSGTQPASGLGRSSVPAKVYTTASDRRQRSHRDSG